MLSTKTIEAAIVSKRKGRRRKRRRKNEEKTYRTEEEAGHHSKYKHLSGEHLGKIQMMENEHSKEALGEEEDGVQRHDWEQFLVLDNIHADVE